VFESPKRHRLHHVFAMQSLSPVDGNVCDDETDTDKPQSRWRVRILFYGRLAEAIGPELEVNALPGCSVAELRNRLGAEYPQVEDVLRSKRARACVGDTLVRDDYQLATADVVEFLPPVSGG
jgi:molybdopterin converting factor small subunit